MNYSQRQIYRDASMVIFTSILSPILVSMLARYFREQIKDKNCVKTQTISIVLIARDIATHFVMMLKVFHMLIRIHVPLKIKKKIQ